MYQHKQRTNNTGSPIQPPPPGALDWSSRPLIMAISAAAALTASSYIRLLTTGSVKVDGNYLSGLPLIINVVLFLVTLTVSGYSYINTVLRRKGYDLDLRQVKQVAVIMAVITFFMMPMLSNDIFSRLAYGELALRGINPYTHAELLRTTIHSSYIGPTWIEAPCVYGPVTVLVDALAALAGRWSLAAGLVVVKLIHLIFAVFFIETAGRFFARSGAAGHRYNIAALVMLAPVFWVMGSGQAHNNMIAAALLMTSLLFMQRRKFVAASLPLVLAIHTKVFAAIAVPLFLILAWVSLKMDRKALVRTMGRSLGIAALLSVVLYLPFWAGGDALRTPAGFLRHKLASKSVARVASSSMAHIEDAVGRTPAVPGRSREARARELEKGLVVSLKIVSLVLAGHILAGFRRFRVFDEYLAAFAALAALVICFFSSVFHPWYLVGALPFFAGIKRREWVVWSAVLFASVSAMNVIHLAGDADIPVRALTAVLIAAVNILFFWKFRSRFIKRVPVLEDR